jgi:hypothetical protein
MSPRNNELPVDKDAKIPPAVKAAVAKSAALHKAAYNTPDEPAAPATPTTPEPAAPTTAAAPAPDAPAAPTPTPAPAAPTTDWEHAFKSMKGRYESERTRREAAEAAALAKTLEPEPAPAPTPSASLLTAQERSEYGDELLDVVARAAEEKFSPVINNLSKQVAELQSRLTVVGQTVVADKRAEMNEGLNAALPNWLEVNRNPKFLDWLGLPDTYSGAIRHELLTKAYAANDTRRVLAFFNGFLAEEAAIAPPAVMADLTPATHSPPAAMIQLADLAAPGRAKSAAPLTGPAEKPSFTRAQVTQFYADSAAGRYRGREADKQRIEAQIHDAGQNGRIR